MTSLRLTAMVVSGVWLMGQSPRALSIHVEIPGFTIRSGTAVAFDAATFTHASGQRVKLLDGRELSPSEFQDIPRLPIRDSVVKVEASTTTDAVLLMTELHLTTPSGETFLASVTPSFKFPITEEGLNRGTLTLSLQRTLVNLTVIDNAQKPMPEVGIEVLGEDLEETLRIVTGGDGQVLLLLPPGKYDCLRPGENTRTTFRVGMQERQSVRLTLNSKQP